MKTTKPLRRRHGLTLIEVLIVIATVVVIGLLFLPFGHHHRGAPRISCVHKLKNIGLAFKIYANDNNDQYPQAVPDEKGGAEYSLRKGDISRVFQVLSNELSDPRLLICPADTRTPATEFTNLLQSNISYFVGLDAIDTKPDMILAGDRDIAIQQTLLTGTQALTADRNVTWSGSLHEEGGNILFADGHVEQLDSAGLVDALKNTGDTNNLVLFPQ